MNGDTIRTIGVIGAGTMGAGIAQVAAQSGYTVILYDINDEVVQAGLDKLYATFDKLVARGKLTAEVVTTTRERITPTSDLTTLASTDVVIEAAPERLDIKQKLFGELGTITAPTAILATNTSTLSVTQIAAATPYPERVVGMHFFNPAPLMPLVEVINGVQTDPAVAERIVILAQNMGKRPVRAQDVPGFIVNRVARPFHLEGLRVLEQGVTPIAVIDRLLRDGGGFKMGPFELQDLIGIDINYAASQSVYEAYFHAPRFRPSFRQGQQVESGQLGRKTGRGWYEYGE